MKLKHPILVISLCFFAFALFKDYSAELEHTAFGQVRFENDMPFVKYIDFDLDNNGYLSYAEATQMYSAFFKAHESKTIGFWTKEDMFERTIKKHPEGSLSNYNKEKISNNIDTFIELTDLNNDKIVSEEEFIKNQILNIEKRFETIFSKKGVDLRILK